MVRLDELRLDMIPPLAHPPMTIIALLNTVAIATEHLADGNAAIVFQDLLVLSYILMSDVVVPVLSSPPTIIGGEQLGIMAVLQ